MRFYLCGTVLCCVLLGAVGFPADPKTSEAYQKLVAALEKGAKQPKQSIFSSPVNINLSKDSNLIPVPSFLNLNTNYANGAGAAANLIVPLAFPLGLLFPGYPPLNLTFGVSANNNVAVGISQTSTTDEPEPDAGWGWAVTEAPTTPGWGWQPPSSTPGWEAPPSTTVGWQAPPPTTTPGWEAPSTTVGWQAPPSTTPGWEAPPPTTTPGWEAPPPTTTPGWGPPPPGWKSPESEKETKKAPSPGSAPYKPSASLEDKERPKPQISGKPVPQMTETHSAPTLPDKGTESQTFIVDIAESSLSSELPALTIPEAIPVPEPVAPETENFEAAAAAHANTHLQNEVNADSHPYFSIMETDDNAVFTPEVPLVQDEPMPFAGPTSLAGVASLLPNSAGNALNNLKPLSQAENVDKSIRISVPIAPFITHKNRRHAEVQIPASSLRIEDFEDVEGARETLYLSAGEGSQTQSSGSGEEEMSKEEMILLAMEHLSSFPQGVQALNNNNNNNGRPNNGRPNNSLLNSPQMQAISVPKPQLATLEQQLEQQALQQQQQQELEQQQEFSEADFADKEEEEEGQEESAAVEAEALKDDEKAPAENDDENVPVEKDEERAPLATSLLKPVPKEPEEKPGKSKHRPYGMDRPHGKNKPHSESGHKNEQFGLPHHHPKEEGTDALITTLMGWQIPNFSLQWSSVADIFNHFMGSRHKNYGMGKSDTSADPMNPTEEKCVDDEEGADSTRTSVIHSGGLCPSSDVLQRCDVECQSKGFSGGTCLGPGPTPGCLCKLPNHKEYGMMLEPLKAEDKDLQLSDSPKCKKCACEESCKSSGSFTGFCMDKCYCANPWFTKV